MEEKLIEEEFNGVFVGMFGDEFPVHQEGLKNYFLRKVSEAREEERAELLNQPANQHDQSVREQVLKEVEEEAKEIGEHFVKFGEKKGVEALDMIIAVIKSKRK